ncbi:transporter [Bacillus sp. SCS-151]|uniref:transporter n=1 Tax=Nanhaiella sioensis TaxID=3115293 RepID=UPI00397DC0D5
MKILYELIMISLVILIILTFWIENSFNSIISWVVWVVFFLDFICRLIFVKNKWEFIKNNPLLIVAIIPFDQFFQLARLVRIIYLFRIKTITKYYVQPLVQRISNLSKLLIILALLIIFSVEALLLWQLESNIISFWHSFYFVIGQLMFFGRDIYQVNHTVSYICVTFNSIVGVVIHGLVIQWFFNRIEPFYLKFTRIQRKGE